MKDLLSYRFLTKSGKNLTVEPRKGQDIVRIVDGVHGRVQEVTPTSFVATFHSGDTRGRTRYTYSLSFAHLFEVAE